MNKLKFFLTMLCAFVGVGAWAVEFNPKDAYSIKSGSQYATTTETSASGDNLFSSTYTVSATPEAFVMAGSTDQGWTIKSISSGKFLGWHHTNGKGWNSGNKESYWDIASTTGTQLLRHWDGDAKGMKVENGKLYTDATGSAISSFDFTKTHQNVTITFKESANSVGTTDGWVALGATVEDLAKANAPEGYRLAAATFATVVDGNYDYVVEVEKGVNWVAKAQTIYEAVSAATGCVGSYNATAAQVADLKTAIDNNDNDACKALVEAIGEKIAFNNKTVYAVKNVNTNLYLRAMDDMLLWAKSGLTYSADDARFQWMLYNDGTYNLLYSVAQGGWANNTKSGSGQSNHWQIVTDQSAMSYVEIVDAGTMFSFRDRDHAGINSACLHNNTAYTTGITNWNPAPGSSGSGWRFYPVETLSDEITASVTTLQQYSAKVKAVAPYVDIYGNLNYVGGKRASAEQAAQLAACISALDASAAEALVATLEDCTISNKKMYAIETTRGAIYWNKDDQPDYANSTGKTGAEATIDRTAPAQQWAIQTTAKGKYLYNIGAAKFARDVDSPDVSSNKGRVGLNAEIIAGDFDIVDNKTNSAAYPWLLKLGTHQMNVSNNYAQPVITFWNDATDSGNQFRIAEVGDYDNTTVAATIAAYEATEATVTVNHKYNGETFKTEEVTLEIGSTEAASWQPTSAIPANRVGVTANIPAAQTITADITVDVTYGFDASALPFQTSDLSAGFKNSTKFYTLKIRGTKNVVYSASNNYAQNSTAEPGLNAKKYFAFTGDNINGFKIYNLGAGTDKAFGSDNTNGTFTADGQLLWFENNSGKNIFHAVNTDNKYVNDNNSKLAYWVSSAGATDDGGNITFAEADADDLVKSAKATFIGAVSPVTTSGKIGDYTQAYVDGVNAVISEVEALSDLEAVLAFTGTVPAAEYRLPAANAFYRIKGTASEKYLSSLLTGEGHSRPAIVDKSADENGTVWYLDANNTLINYAAGVGIKETHTLAAYSETFHKWSFAPAAAGVPSLALVSDYTGSKYLCDWTDGYANRFNADAVANRTAWQIEEVNSIPVTVGEDGYAPICLPLATTIPTGVKVYVAGTEEKDGTIDVGYIPEDDNILPANCAAFIEAVPGTYYFDVNNSADALARPLKAASTTTSHFKGTTSAIATPANAVLLTVDNAESKLLLTPATGASLPGFSMYYQASASDTNIALTKKGIITAIQAAGRTDLIEGETYNINGQQVKKANGLIIVNGQKYLVK